MTSATGSGLEIAGWLALAALAIVFVLQSRNLRAFTRPRATPCDSWPSLSVIVPSAMPDSDARRVVSELPASGYEGDLDIVLVPPRDVRAELLAPLTLASSRVRIAEVPGSEASIAALTTLSRGALTMIVPASIRLEPDAVARLVSELEERGENTIVLQPRLELRGRGILLEPMIPWTRLTFSAWSGNDDHLDGSAVLITRSDSQAVRSVRQADGYDLATRPALSSAGRLDTIRRAAGTTPPRRIVTATALVLLFALPPVLAIATKSFPWVVAGIASYWMRLRVSIRTGEPVAGCLIHPVAALTTAILTFFETTDPAQRT